jgi:hypothetical protein
MTTETETNDEIIEMARQAEFDLDETPNMLYTVRGNYAQLEAFAKLVAEKAAAKEREACAKLCEDGPERQNSEGVFLIDNHSCAAAIRARGQA